MARSTWRVPADKAWCLDLYVLSRFYLHLPVHTLLTGTDDRLWL
jgi:hypothetical protein